MTNRLDIPVSAETAANLLKKPNQVLEDMNLGNGVVPRDYQMAEVSCSIEIHPWRDDDTLYMSLWDAIRLHFWLIEASQTTHTAKPFEINGLPLMWKDGFVVRVHGNTRCMSTDTVSKLIKAIGEQVHQIKQTCSSLINF